MPSGRIHVSDSMRTHSSTRQRWSMTVSEMYAVPFYRTRTVHMYVSLIVVTNCIMFHKAVYCIELSLDVATFSPFAHALQIEQLFFISCLMLKYFKISLHLLSPVRSVH